MADVNFPRTVAPPARPAAAPSKPAATHTDIIELLFFAYRDFVADADHLLEAYGFGRAHHRVLHFVDRNPGLTVADLLDILKITKQSLARVLKELIDEGYIVQREGAQDRRQRLLRTTAKGNGLAADLAALQSKRIASALAETGPGGHAVATRFLFALIDPGERSSVSRLLGDAVSKSEVDP
jgi:DNA-binding MarR family transcriptional regulator